MNVSIKIGKSNKYLLAIGTIIAVFILNACSDNQMQNDSDIYVDPEIDVTYSKGNTNADVIVIQFGEYECQFCSKFALEVLPQLQEEYIATGKILYIFKDFPIENKKNSNLASQTTYCAGDQGEEKYWEMHIKLFENYDKLSEEDLYKYAEEKRLESNSFKNCLTSEKYKNLVTRNKQQGENLDVNNNPTLIINNEKLVGLQPYENIKKVIDTHLKEKE